MMQLFLRSFIVLGWTLLIGIALYLPRWYQNSASTKTLNIFAWGDLLDPNIITEFEEKTGIHVNLNYYSSNEELLVKLKATGGEGYDLIAPSDYAVNLLIQEDLLQPLDKTALSFFPDLTPYLCHHFFDPENRYSIPFAWEIFGLGIDTHVISKNVKPSWGMLFEDQGYKVTMINDPISAVEMAAFYLFGSSDFLNAQQSLAVKNLLIQQKGWVEAYADSRGDYYLATKNCAVAVASSSYIFRSMRLFDFIGFLVPQEGTFVTIENLCIPKASSKQKLAYTFLNYLYTQSSMNQHFNAFGFFPATYRYTTEGLDPQAKTILKAAETDFSKYHFFKNILPQQEVRDMMVEIKCD